MGATRTKQLHLERRPGGFAWRRRWPRGAGGETKKLVGSDFLVFPLRTHLLVDAKITARRLTAMSDRIFAATAETTMALPPELARTLLVQLARFEIAAFERTRALAPARSPEAAALELAREAATQEVLRRALLLRDREAARAPLRHVAALMGLALDETEPDWQALAIEATRVLLDVSHERARRDQGLFESPSRAFRSAMAELEGGVVPVRSHVSGGEAPDIAPLPFASVISGSSNPAQAAVEPVTTVLADPGTVHLSSPALAGPHASSLVAGRPSDPSQTDPPLLLARPTRTPGQEQVFRFYFRHLSPESQQAVMRPEGPTVSEAFNVYYELKAKGFDCNRVHVLQKTAPTTGPTWVASSGNKVECAARIWTDFVGDQPIEQVSSQEIQDGLDLLWRVPAVHGKLGWRAGKGFHELIERADSREAENIAAGLRALEKRGNPTPAEIEAARIEAKVGRFRATNYVKHGRLSNAVGRMLLSLGVIHQNPFSICTWSNAEEKLLRRNEESRARTVWDDRIYDLYRTRVFQQDVEDPGEPLFWAPLIARHQGLRMEEALQLGPDDFGTQNGIPYMQVRNLDGNSVKSEAGERMLPVHPNLIDLGLMELVELRRRQGQPRLFPHLTRGATKGNFTELFTKAFGYYRKSNNVYWRGLDFHAFRTTFHGDLLNNHCSDAIRRRLMGHAPLDEGEKSYVQGLSTEALLQGILAVKVDVSMIRSPFRRGEPREAPVTARAAQIGLRLVS